MAKNAVRCACRLCRPEWCGGRGIAHGTVLRDGYAIPLCRRCDLPGEHWQEEFKLTRKQQAEDDAWDAAAWSIGVTQ